MQVAAKHREKTIDSQELVAPKAPSFLEALRRDRDLRYPISSSDRAFEEQVTRVCARIASLLPGSEIPEVIRAREAFQTATRLGDTNGIEAARVAAVSACLRLSLSATLPAVGEIAEEVTGIKAANTSTSDHVLGAAQSSLAAYDAALDPSKAAAGYLVGVPEVAALVDSLLSVNLSGVINTTKEVWDLSAARFAKDFARRFALRQRSSM